MAIKEEQEKKRLLSPPSKEEEMVLMKEKIDKLEGYLTEDVVQKAFEEVKTSRGDQLIEETKESKGNLKA